MKKLLLLVLTTFLTLSSAHACNPPPNEKNIQILKAMFKDFAEGLDITKLDLYYSKDFILESNNQSFNYQQYKDLEGGIYKTLKSLKVTRYDDVFAAGDKVVSRMWIKLVNKNGQTHEFQVFAIAKMQDGKITRIWELTYPTWSDKLK